MAEWPALSLTPQRARRERTFRSIVARSRASSFGGHCFSVPGTSSTATFWHEPSASVLAAVSEVSVAVECEE